MKNQERISDDPLVVIEGEARAVATSYGASWCEEAGAALIRRIVRRLGGVQVYVPRQSGDARRLRDKMIRSKFNGRNVRALAIEFEMSERTVRRILEADVR